MLNLMYLKLLYLDSALEEVVTASKKSIGNFLDGQQGVLIGIFVGFVLALIIGVSVSATLGMDFLFMHYSATKSILNLIPGKRLVDLSEKTNLKKI